MSADLDGIIAGLREHPAVLGKRAIAQTLDGLGLDARSPGTPGDDAAILPRAGGVDLLAGEGFIPAFVKDDPGFAGWCGVMVNLSDIAAMGGRAVGLVNQVWAESPDAARPLLEGLRAASTAYGVPIVGGHTNFGAPELGLAVSVMGRAERVITSADAAPGDHLVIAADHRGAYVNFDNFCAALDAPPPRLRGDLAILPELAARDLVRAGKDISQGGIAGTALMLAESSECGIEIDLDAIDPPPGVPMERWMRSFPSFGFLLSVRPRHVSAVLASFQVRDIWAGVAGTVTAARGVRLRQGRESRLFWDYDAAPYLGLAPRAREDA